MQLSHSYLWDPVLRSGPKKRSWRKAEGNWLVSRSLREEAGGGRRKTGDNLWAEAGTRARESDVSAAEGLSVQGLPPRSWGSRMCRQFLKVMWEPRDHPQTTRFLFQGGRCMAGMKLATEASFPVASIQGPHHPWQCVTQWERFPSVPRDIASNLTHVNNPPFSAQGPNDSCTDRGPGHPEGQWQCRREGVGHSCMRTRTS